MKKSVLFLLSLLILNIFIIPIYAQEPIPGLPDLPGIADIDESTGLPSEFTKFKETADSLSEEERREEYLKQEWTKILAKNKVLSPILFYTDKFFSFFNPLWKYTFGLEFSWSWAFIFSIIIWIILIILIYSPVKSLSEVNPIITLIASIIISSLAGSTRIIAKTIDILATMIKNVWLVGLSIVIAAAIAYFYSKFIKQIGKDMKEKAEKEKTTMAQKTIQTHGEVSKKALEGYKNKK